MRRLSPLRAVIGTLLPETASDADAGRVRPQFGTPPYLMARRYLIVLRNQPRLHYPAIHDRRLRRRVASFSALQMTRVMVGGELSPGFEDQRSAKSVRER
jgi:hypothetical protein